MSPANWRGGVLFLRRWCGLQQLLYLWAEQCQGIEATLCRVRVFIGSEHRRIISYRFNGPEEVNYVRRCLLFASYLPQLMCCMIPDRQ